MNTRKQIAATPTRSSTLLRAAVSGLLSAMATVAHSQTSSTATNLEEVIVTGKIDFTENDAFGATKMGLELKDTPQTVNVVTSDLIEVANLKSFKDFYKVDASTGVTHSTDGWPRSYYRGFFQDGANTVRVDGFRMPGQNELDLALFDRFEVIKGGTSTLYGQNNIGGALNAVSKLPQQKFGAEFSTEIGQYDDYRAEGDITGALFGSDSWAFRLIGVYEDAESFIDYAERNVELISGSIMFQPTSQTRAVLRYSHQKTDGRYAYGNILQLQGEGEGSAAERALDEGLELADLPRSRYFGMPWNNNTKESDFVQMQVEHGFSGWRVRALAQYNENKEDGQNFWAGGPIDQDGNGDFMWSYGGQNEGELFGAELNLFGDFELFGMRNTLFVGVDYADMETNTRSASSATFGYDASVFNAFGPDYAAVEGPPAWDSYNYFYGIEDDQELFGATVQLIARPIERVSILVAARYSDDKVKNGFAFAFSPDELADTPLGIEDVSVSKNVYQAGVTFDVTDAISLYASYGETFEPQNRRVFVEGDEDGKLIDPLEGTSYEIGVKANANEDLLFTAAIFELEKTNIAISDAANGWPYAFPIGKQRSRGIELGLQGKILPPLSINASIAWLDAEYLEGPFKGLQPANAPKFGASVFATYEILEGALRGFGLSAGIVHKSGRDGFDASWTEEVGAPVVFDFGDFTEVDVGAFYGMGPWMFNVSVTNLFNEKYYSQTFEELWWSSNVNPPSTIRGRVTYRF